MQGDRKNNLLNCSSRDYERSHTVNDTMLETSIVKAEGMNVRCFGIGLMRKVTFCTAGACQAIPMDTNISWTALNMLSCDRVEWRQSVHVHTEAFSVAACGCYLALARCACRPGM